MWFLAYNQWLSFLQIELLITMCVLMEKSKLLDAVISFFFNTEKCVYEARSVFLI